MRIILLLVLAFFSSISYSEPKASYRLEVVAEGLNYPWSIAFLPNGDYLVSARSGELRRVTASGEIGEPLANTPKTYVASQGGYFDVVLDPEFADNQTIYLAFAHGTRKANATRIIKAELSTDRIENVRTIFTVAPEKDTPVHYGGRMQFINDGTLLVTTGDGFNYREASQDKFSQLGKVIRINSDGSVPTNNPFADGKEGNPKVYSSGHRSPQGLSYNAQTNTVYLHEHGPKGGDEVNIITAGNNYGWPATSYGVNYSGAIITPFTQAPGITDPIHYWVPSIAPSGMTHYTGEAFPAWRGNLFIGALVNQDVRRLILENDKVVKEEIMFSEIGERIRDIRMGPKGNLYILTDNGRGKIIRVVPNN